MPRRIRIRLVRASSLLGLALAAAPIAGQQATEDAGPRATERPAGVFRSTQALNLPTVETLRQGDWLFEISHRFVQPVSDAMDALLGLDGPVRLRLGLGYAVSDRITVTLQRSNLQDNLELNLKAHLWSRGGEGTRPTAVGLQVGGAWNGELPRVQPEPREWQYYAMLMVNQRLGSNVAIGLVPSWVHDPDVFSSGAEDAFSLGAHGQWWLSRRVSLLGEWNLSEPWDDRVHDAGAFGVEIEARGHFFKLLLTNQTALNTTQFLTGSRSPFEPDEWRIGFNITRVLRF